MCGRVSVLHSHVDHVSFFALIRSIMVQETTIQTALEAIRNKSVPSIRSAAQLFAVSRSTLQGRLNGATSVRAAHEPFQRLDSTEEASLIKQR